MGTDSGTRVDLACWYGSGLVWFAYGPHLEVCSGQEMTVLSCPVNWTPLALHLYRLLSLCHEEGKRKESVQGSMECVGERDFSQICGYFLFQSSVSTWTRASSSTPASSSDSGPDWKNLELGTLGEIYDCRFCCVFCFLRYHQCSPIIVVNVLWGDDEMR